MIKSMTGFGRAEQNVGDKTFLVDIKSLNGKQFDLQLKMPAFLKPFEFDIRRILSDKLGRGTVDCTISLKETGNAKPVSINTDLANEQTGMIFKFFCLAYSTACSTNKYPMFCPRRWRCRRKSTCSTPERSRRTRPETESPMT